MASSGDRTEVAGEGIYLLCCQPPLKCTQALRQRGIALALGRAECIWVTPSGGPRTGSLQRNSHTHTPLPRSYIPAASSIAYLEVTSSSLSPNEIPCLSPRPIPSQWSALFELLFPQTETSALSLVHHSCPLELQVSNSYPFHPPSKKPTSTSHPVPPQAPVLSVSAGQGSSLQVASVTAPLLLGVPTLPGLPSTAPQERAQHALGQAGPVPGIPCAAFQSSNITSPGQSRPSPGLPSTPVLPRF